MTIKSLPNWILYSFSVVVVIAIVALFFTGFIIQQFREQHSEHNLNVVSAIVASGIHDKVLLSSTIDNWRSDDAQALLSEFASNLRSDPNVLTIIIYRPDGTVIWSDNPTVKVGMIHELDDVTEAITEGIFATPASSDFIKSLNRSDIVAVEEVYSPITANDFGTIGVVEVYFDDTDHLRSMQAISRYILLSTLISISLIGLLLWSIFTRQYKFINEQANQIADFATTLEKTVKERTSELAESEKKYRELVDGALIGIIRTSLKGEILYSNIAFARMLGFDSVDDFKAVNITTLYADPKDRTRMIDAIKKNHGKISEFELALRNRSGEIRNLLVNITLNQDVLEGMALDITRRKVAEAELIRKSEEQQRFTALMVGRELQMIELKKKLAKASGEKPEEIK